MFVRKRVLWAVPAYCIAAGLVSFLLSLHVLGKFTLVTLPDGTTTVDTHKWLVMSGIIFLITILLGGLSFFSKMTRKEVFYSASILVVFNVITGLISYKTQGWFNIFCSIISDWDSFLVQLLVQSNLNPWQITILLWAVPYVFILFGKKQEEDRT